MNRKILTFFILGIFLISFASASCSVSLDKEVYVAGETATAAMSCTTNPEKNTDYTLNWTYQNGTSVEIDTGTTPNIVNQLFYQSYMIPSNWPAGIFLNASLSGDGLTVAQNDSANVTGVGGGGTNTLEIVNTTFGGGYLGLVSSVKATVTDETGKKISGGLCGISILSNDETKVLLESYGPVIKGMIGLSEIFPHTRFSENQDYAYEVECYCGSSGSSTECIDEDGTPVNNSVGSAKNFFTTLSWLDSNTVTSINGNVSVGNEFSICANVTNSLSNDRVVLDITYNWRCGSGSNSDVDRIVLGEYSEARGISASTTQMQCHDFVVPNEKSLEKGGTVCYGATDVSVISESGERLVTYSTTSSQFNVTISSIHPTADFERVSKNIYFSNVSFNDFDVGVKNVHVILDGDLNGDETSASSIVNYSVKYMNGSAIPYSTRIFFHEHAVRFQETLVRDDAIEVEIANVNTSLDEFFNLTIEFENYDERQTQALEGINNKTGTFHLDVDCPSQGQIGSNINCSITAQVEDTQLVQKEVDFTCYITDGIVEYSNVNFNQMVTRVPVTLYREFAVQSVFLNGQSLVLQCYADYYNLGSRRDSFYDTFTAVTSADSGGSNGGSITTTSPITGDAIDGSIGPGDESEDEGGIFSGPLDKEDFNNLMKWLGIIALVLLGFALFTRKRDSKYSKVVLWFFVLLVLVGGLIYGIGFLNSKIGEVQIIKDAMFRGIVLALFIVLLVVILFRSLNVRGEIKFGEDDLLKHHHKNSKLQSRINNEILRKELRDLKKSGKYKVIKVKRS